METCIVCKNEFDGLEHQIICVECFKSIDKRRKEKVKIDKNNKLKSCVVCLNQFEPSKRGRCCKTCCEECSDIIKRITNKSRIRNKEWQKEYYETNIKTIKDKASKNRELNLERYIQYDRARKF